VAVLVHDDLGVLGVVHSALAVGDRQLARAVVEERVVAAELVDPHQLLAAVDGRQRRAEAERLDVQLGLGDPVVGHRLLELVLVARVDEALTGVGGGLAGRAQDLGVVARERPGVVQVGQRVQVVRVPQHRVG
jgi:hypothetical protein